MSVLDNGGFIGRTADYGSTETYSDIISITHLQSQDLFEPDATSFSGTFDVSGTNASDVLVICGGGEATTTTTNMTVSSIVINGVSASAIVQTNYNLNQGLAVGIFAIVASNANIDSNTTNVTVTINFNTTFRRTGLSVYRLSGTGGIIPSFTTDISGVNASAATVSTSASEGNATIAVVYNNDDDVLTPASTDLSIDYQSTEVELNNGSYGVASKTSSATETITTTGAVDGSATVAAQVTFQGVITNKKNSGLWNLDASYKNFLPDIYTNSLVLWMDAVNEKSYGVSENFVPYSADITPSAYPDWIPVNSVSSTATTGVDGQNDAFILSDNDATNYAGVYIVDDNNAAVYETVQTMTAICHVKKNTGGPVALINVYFQDTPSFTNGTVYSLYLNPDNGIIIGGSAINTEVVSEGDWWRVMFEVETEGAGYDRMVWNIYPAERTAGFDTDPTITGSNTFWNPQLQRGPKSNYSRPVKTGSTPIKREERWWDVSGQNNDGVVTGGAVYNSTYFEFDGSDDYIELGTITTSNPLQLSSPADGGLTIMFATYWDGTGDSYQRIIDKSNGGSGSNGWCIYPSSASPPAGNLIFQANPGTAYGLDSGQTLVVSTWEIWTVTHDQTSGDWVWYRNGKSIATGNATYNVPNVQTNARIGTWNHSTAREWNGRIGFMLVYEKALTQREITQNYNALKGNYGL